MSSNNGNRDELMSFYCHLSVGNHFCDITLLLRDPNRSDYSLCAKCKPRTIVTIRGNLKHSYLHTRFIIRWKVICRYLQALSQQNFLF